MLARLKWWLAGFMLVVAVATASPALCQNQVVRDVQERLTTFGYDLGPVDGVMGPKTRSALMSFQEKGGLPVTGEADARTLSALGITSAPAATAARPAAPSFAHQQPIQELSPPISQTPPPLAEVSTQDLASEPASRPIAQTSTGHPVNAAPGGGGFSKWWLVPIGLVLLLFWRRRRRKPAAASGDRDLRSEVDARGVRVSVDRPSRRPAAARWQVSPQNGNDFWLPTGQSKSVAGHETGGMVYVGRGLRSQRSGKAENCLIDPSLPVAKRNADYAGDHMPYWPSYSEIPPTSRLAYLQWLSSGRSDPEAELGYVFLYFYGLERRLFLDRPTEKEASALIAEIYRLRGIYSGNRSFDRYSMHSLVQLSSFSTGRLPHYPTLRALLTDQTGSCRSP